MEDQNENFTSRFEEPSEAYLPELNVLKTRILHKIEEETNMNTLRKVWSVLDDNSNANKTNDLSKHIDSIFNQYEETLTKLAQ
jgi:hypothetical protein